MPRETIGKIAARYLRDHEHKSVMWGDTFILHAIAEAAGMPHEGARTMRRVLNALDKSKELVKLYVEVRMLRGGARPVRCFYLPEHVPEDLKESS